MLEPGYVPSAFRFDREIVAVNTRVTVNDAGDRIIQTGSFDVYDAFGHSLYSSSTSRNARRMTTAPE